MRIRPYFLVSLLVGLTSLFGVLPVSAQDTEYSTGESLQDYQLAKPLTAGISKTLYLPPEMYGQWSVTGSIVETNAPEFFNATVHDIWVLDRVDDVVVVSNPVSGASASIQVERVDRNTATFYRMTNSKNGRVFFEMPTISVNGDTLSGQTINKFQSIKNGKVIKSYYARYSLQAKRIGGPSVKFINDDTKPDIEINDSELQP